MNFRGLVLRPSSNYSKVVRFLSSKRDNTSSWDPTVSLDINHQALVFLEKCRTKNHFNQILGHIVTSGLAGKTFPISRLINFCALSHPEYLNTAILLFDHLSFTPNLFIYNIMISALSVSQKTRSFSMYGSMISSGTYPDKHTLLYLLRASQFVSEVKQIHGHAIVAGVFFYGYLRNSLIKLYLEKGSRNIAQQVFGTMSEPDAVSYNIMIVGNAKEGFFSESIELFREMLRSGLEPDEYTMVGLAMCCGELRESRLGKSVHVWVEKRKCRDSSKLVLGNAVLDMYVKLREFDNAIKVFNSLKEQDLVSWNTMISGYIRAGEFELALSFFEKLPRKDLVTWNSLIAGFSNKGDYRKVASLFNAMVAENFKPNNVTMVSLVSVAAGTGALDRGKKTHGLIVRLQIKVDAILGSALVDMYCKCGSVELAFVVFKGVTTKDVALWTAMISGFALHGYGNKALDMFIEMQKFVNPNEITIIAVLTACTHSGFVDEGLNIFHSMKEKFGIEPGIEHYGCLVDLLGRSGRLFEAKAVIENMPMRPSRSIWGAMLSGCREFGNVELAEIAMRKLIMLEPEREGGYVLMSNIYAASEKWKDSDMVREAMERRGVKKTAGCSSVVVDGLVHSFVATEFGHPRLVEIFSVLKCLNREMKLGEKFHHVIQNFLVV